MIGEPGLRKSEEDIRVPDAVDVVGMRYTRHEYISIEAFSETEELNNIAGLDSRCSVNAHASCNFCKAAAHQLGTGPGIELFFFREARMLHEIAARADGFGKFCAGNV